MKIVKAILILFNFMLLEVTIIVFGSMANGNFSNPDYPGQCYVSTDEIYKPGTYNILEKCEKHICHEDGIMVFMSCIDMEAPRNCESQGYVNNMTVYPECCKKEFICINVNGTEETIIV